MRYFKLIFDGGFFMLEKSKNLQEKIKLFVKSHRELYMAVDSDQARGGVLKILFMFFKS